MAGNYFPRLIFISVFIFKLLITIVNGADIFLEWNVAINTTVHPFSEEQPVITINGMFPGPLINATTNDVIHVNVFNNIDEPLLFTWNGIEQRLNSWQDGVSGTNCPIQPGKNWTYEFQVKDQIGTFIYFPSINFLKAGGGFGPIRVNNRPVTTIPFPKPEAEFDLLIGDWYLKSYKEIRSLISNNSTANDSSPDKILMNGKGSYFDNDSRVFESFTVTKGKTYWFRISNVGTAWSVNFRIQNHRMVLVETEGSYVNQMALDSLDVHVGQSYSVLVTADQEEQDYYIVAAPKQINATGTSNLIGVAVLRYGNSVIPPRGALPPGPDPFNIQFSVNQAKSIRWNLTAGAARPNPQGSFNVSNVTLSQSFILQSSVVEIDGEFRYTVNNVSYVTPETPLKLADAFASGGNGVYVLDKFSTNSSNVEAVNGVFVASGIHHGWIELVLKNDLDFIHTWQLDGYSFFVVGFGDEQWTPNSRYSYNTYDPVARSTIQVYPRRWIAVYAYLDNPGMWNLRSQHLKNWYLGQELYLRVYDPDPNPDKEKKPPENMLLCAPLAPTNIGSPSKQITWFHTIVIYIVTLVCIIR
ncbi:monocopper oxidase-like protein SKU5 isoform X2 [Gossypium hirsutum]|uniref:Monocopper oxidase-like protein SKU5 isoform X2 n=1 Tax=Gossypium hirsutum TaxID=3635 RepID=A0ABM3BML6_GOSHI|nr:monocopper oxidase-like protein SKU5 isoform X2 [Gossypium hirsutum]